MKVTQTHLRIVLLVLAAVLIGFGLVKVLWKDVNFGPEIENNIGNVVMFAALAIFLWNRQMRTDEKKRADAEAKKLEDEKASPEKVDPPASVN